MVRFGLNDAEEVEASAVVVWARSQADDGPPGMGLMFQEVNADQLEQIRQILKGETRTKKPDS